MFVLYLTKTFHFFGSRFYKTIDIYKPSDVTLKNKINSSSNKEIKWSVIDKWEHTPVG